MSQRHKWSGINSRKRKTSNNGGLAVSCVKCGCVKEYVKGYATYFINDNVYYKNAPKCLN